MSANHKNGDYFEGRCCQSVCPASILLQHPQHIQANTVHHPRVLPFVPTEPANAVICNGMVQVPTLKIFHDHEGAVRLQACPNELHNVAVMTTFQNGNLLLENI